MIIKNAKNTEIKLWGEVIKIWPLIQKKKGKNRTKTRSCHFNYLTIFGR